MKNRYKLLALFLCTLLAVSCGTKKHAVSSAATGVADATQDVQTVNANPQNEPPVTAKLGLMLQNGNNNVSIGGTLRMKRDDVIQISLVTFGILEVARIEATPDYFLLVDKMGKQYVKAAYSDVSFLSSANIDFRTLQAYFWNEQTSTSAAWERSDFVSIGGRSFPSKHIITVREGSKPIKAEFTLSNFKNDSAWETRTQLPARYKEVPVDDLIQRIMTLTM